MTSESNRISKLSVNYVDNVLTAWGWSWTAINQSDDDGIDGIVYCRQFVSNPTKPTDRRSWRHDFTGGLIHVQVKTSFDNFKVTATHIEVTIKNAIQKREMWRKSTLPVVVVFVEAFSIGSLPSRGWWVDVHASGAFLSEGRIQIPLKQRFQSGVECRHQFARLARGLAHRANLPIIDMATPFDLEKLLDPKLALKHAARDFYKKWSERHVQHHKLGDVIINRTGWAHITRVGRPKANMHASWQLLPAAARIVEKVIDWNVVRRSPKTRTYSDGSWSQYDYISLNAMVKLLAREPSEVCVILRRETRMYPNADGTGIASVVRKTWFFTVYEPGRRSKRN